MKIKELFEAVDWTSKSEKQQIAQVKRGSVSIQGIRNPSEAVQLAIIDVFPPDIRYIENPTQKVLLMALKSKIFINMTKTYETFIRKYFASNTLLMKKWLRCGEAMRELQ